MKKRKLKRLLEDANQSIEGFRIHTKEQEQTIAQLKAYVLDQAVAYENIIKACKQEKSKP